jgi:hypothetical protein
MPKKRPGERTQLEKCFEYLSRGIALTPREIDSYTGAIGYSSKFICLLKKNHGCTFEILKNGRNIISYQLLSVGKIMTQASVTLPESKEIQNLLKTLDIIEKNGENGEIVSYAVDPDWDYLDAIEFPPILDRED